MTEKLTNKILNEKFEDLCERSGARFDALMHKLTDLEEHLERVEEKAHTVARIVYSILDRERSKKIKMAGEDISHLEQIMADLNNQMAALDIPKQKQSQQPKEL